MKKRNILWLTMDHVTFHQMRNLPGAHPVLPTFDKLCAQGYCFDNCKSAHPLCLPCRASMLTGLYTHHHGHERNKPFNGQEYVATPLHDLKNAGYSLGYFGKNHSGYESLASLGFEGWTSPGYGNPYMSGEYKRFLAENGYENPRYHQQWHMHPTPLGFSAFPDSVHDLTAEDDFNQNNCGYLENDEPVHESDFLVWMAGNWMKQHADQPFVLRVDTWGPHHAYHPPKAALDYVNEDEITLPPSLYMDATQRPGFTQQFLQHCIQDMPNRNEKTFRMLLHRAYCQYSYIDKTFGKLLQLLEDLHLSEDTAILMTADHGDALASAGGFFDKCGDMQEELMDIPMVVYDPWAKNPRHVDSFVSNLDVVPTIMDLAGVETKQPMDGISLLALAENRVPARESLMCEHYGHFNSYVLQRALYCGDYKYIYSQNETEQLYHLASDPFEMKNLALDEKNLPILQTMREKLAAARKQAGDAEIEYTKEN